MHKCGHRPVNSHFHYNQYHSTLYSARAWMGCCQCHRRCPILRRCPIKLWIKVPTAAAASSRCGQTQLNTKRWQQELFQIGLGSPTTFYETAFFHEKSKSLIVTDAVAKITPSSIPELNDPGVLLLVSKRSTSDPQPEDTPEARLAGWE